MAFPTIWLIKLLLLTFFAWLLFLGVHPNVQKEFDVDVTTGSLKWFVFSFAMANSLVIAAAAVILGLGCLTRLFANGRPSWEGIFRTTLVITTILVILANFGSWYGKCRETKNVEQCSPLLFLYSIVTGSEGGGSNSSLFVIPGWKDSQI